MENKQTAVDWYFDKIKSHFEHDGDLYEIACMTYAIAKQKEAEMILKVAKESFRNGRDYLSEPWTDQVYAENYYNENYKQPKQ